MIVGAVPVAMFFAPFAVIMLATRFVGMRWLQLLPPPVVVGLGLLTYGAGLFGMTTIALAPLCGALFGFGYGVTLPSSIEWSTRLYHAKPKARRPDQQQLSGRFDHRAPDHRPAVGVDRLGRGADGSRHDGCRSISDDRRDTSSSTMTDSTVRVTPHRLLSIALRSLRVFLHLASHQRAMAAEPNNVRPSDQNPDMTTCIESLSLPVAEANKSPAV
jgi:hypothetical protein